jgi:hypothetical protein
MSPSPIGIRGGLVGAALHLTLILFLITSGRSSPTEVSEELSGSPGVNKHITPSTADVDAEGQPFVKRSSSFPTAFNTLGNNFTETSCPDFFHTFLNDTTYQSCHAIAPLLENSNSFFKAMSSSSTLDPLLDTSCSANITECSTFMTNMASNLTSNKNCGSDYQLGNPTVVQAYDSMLSYGPIAKAACLKDPSTENYCFTEAATNSSNVANFYLYLLPLGNSLPGGSRPTCNKCTQATMQVFQQSAIVKGNPLVNTYLSAAEVINVNCGPGFVNATVNVGTQDATKNGSSAGSRLGMSPSLSSAAICLLSVGGMLLASL